MYYRNRETQRRLRKQGDLNYYSPYVGGKSPKTAYRLINRAQRLYELYKWEETGKRINEAIIQLAACWIVSRRAVKCNLVREDFISELEGGK